MTTRHPPGPAGTPRPIRLLLYCGATEWGGAEAMLGRLLGALGPEVSPALIGIDEEILGRILRYRPGTPVTTVPGIRDKSDVRAMLAQRRAMRRARADVIQLNLPVPFAEPYSVLAALTVRGSRVVALEHLPMPVPWPGIRLLRRLTTPRLAAHVAVGTASAREVEAIAGRPTGSVRVIWNGVPSGDSTRPATSSWRRPPGAALVVGGIGRLHRQKGFDVLLRSLVELPDVHLVLVGDGPERDPLAALAQRLGVADRVHVTGWTDDSAGWLEVVDVVALPSRFEGLPLVLLEAMLARRAVVSTDVGSITDAVQDGRTGLLVPVDDHAALAGALARLRGDPDLRARLGDAAGHLAEQRFTVPVMAAAYETLYRELLERR